MSAAQAVPDDAPGRADLQLAPAGPDLACTATVGRDGPPCGSTRGLRRLFIGWQCVDCALPGAEIYEYAAARTSPDGPGLALVPDVVVALAEVAGAGDTGRRDVAAPSRLPAPDRPGARVQAEPTDTAAQAAVLAWGRSGRPRRRLLERFIVVGEQGMTSWEAWTWYRATHGDIDLYSLRPRLTELKRDGWLADSGRRRHPRGHGVDSAPAEEVLVLSARGRAEASSTPAGDRS